MHLFVSSEFHTSLFTLWIVLALLNCCCTGCIYFQFFTILNFWVFFFPLEMSIVMLTVWQHGNSIILRRFNFFKNYQDYNRGQFFCCMAHTGLFLDICLNSQNLEICFFLWPGWCLLSVTCWSLSLSFSGQKTGGQELIGGLNCTVHRNFFGSQVTQKKVSSSTSESHYSKKGCSLYEE